MSICRTCLTWSAEKDITELIVDEKTTSYEDILLYCLDIKVIEEDNGSRKLCLDCYKNILSFYEFKCQVQKNEFYWRSLDVENENGANSIIISEIKREEPFNNNVVLNNESGNEFDEDFTIKLENANYCESDNELLSVIKEIKNEGRDVAKENDVVKRKYTRKTRARKSQSSVSQVCMECGKTVRNLKEHMHQHQPPGERCRYKCSMCDKTFATKSARCRHYSTKHLGVKKRCSICGKEVVSLRDHLLKMHSPERLPHECAVCARRFISRSVLAAHATVHTAARPHQCDQCEKAFRSKIVMLQHRRQVHDKEKSHLCQFCSKSFFKKYHLQVHLRTHSNEKPYECKECGKFFLSTTTLKNHKLLHNEFKMFECTQCDMTFRSPRYLKVHMISHTKVKKYPCKYCGVKFGRSDHRKRHERTAHERHLLATAT